MPVRDPRDTASEFEPVPPAPVEFPQDDTRLTPPTSAKPAARPWRTENLLSTLRVHTGPLTQITSARTSNPAQFEHWADALASGGKLPEARRRGGVSLETERNGIVAALRDYDLPLIRKRAALYMRAVESVLIHDDDAFDALRPFGQTQPEPKPAEQPPTPRTPDEVVADQTLYALGASRCTCNPEPSVSVVDGAARLTYKHASTCQQRGYVERVLGAQGIELHD